MTAAVNLKRKFDDEGAEQQSFIYKRARVADPNYRSPFENMQASSQTRGVQELQQLFERKLQNCEFALLQFDKNCEGFIENLSQDLRIEQIDSVAFTSMKVSHFMIKKVLLCFPNLEEVHIEKCSWVESDAPCQVDRNNHVIQLNIDATDISDRGLGQVLDLVPSLDHFQLVQCDRVSSTALALAIKRIASTLSYLDIAGSTINGSDFKQAVESCSKLSYLFFNFCDLTFDELMNVNYPESLEQLDCEGTNMDPMEEMEFRMTKLSLSSGGE